MKYIRAKGMRFKALKIIQVTAAMAIIVVVMQASQLNANIYSWTDANGIKHFSNVPPPPSIDTSIDVRQEFAYDRDADEERWELDQQDWETIKQNLNKAEVQNLQENIGNEINNDSKSLKDKVEQEKYRLTLEISRLEKLPANSFEKGLDGKRASIAFYESRLLELKSNPERYFDMR